MGTIYIYDVPKSAKRIIGKTKPKKPQKGEMEITIDKEGKSLLIYSKEDVERTKKILSEISDIRKLDYDESVNKEDGTISKYLNFKLHGTEYKIRMSDHTYKSPHKAVLKGCRYNRKRWTIEASISRYKPEDVIEIVKNIDKNTTKYQSSRHKEKLKNFAKKELSDGYNQDMEDSDAITYLARIYLKKREILDDKYQTKYCVLKKIFADIINEGDYS